MSEDPTIERFEPHVPATNPAATPAVWAVDTRHLPLFWFPRDCPRGCAWASERTSSEDRDRFFADTDAARIHVIEERWLPVMRTTTLHLYRLPDTTFVPHDEVGGYWTSAVAVEPLSCVPLVDLPGAHAAAGIDLRVVPSIWPWWRTVVDSTLEYSGSRLANAGDHPDRFGV